MTNHYVKYEDFVINAFQDNQRKPCGLPTDRPTDRQTDISKTIYPFFCEGGHNNEVMDGHDFAARSCCDLDLKGSDPNVERDTSLHREIVLKSDFK
jgi:hypothetical protein